MLDFDNGGTAVIGDFALTANGNAFTSGDAQSVSAGSFDLAESGPAGYTGSDWVCVGGTQDDADTVTLGLGESATCTITNTDDPISLTWSRRLISTTAARRLSVTSR